jgi:hypothetical protein
MARRTWYSSLLRALSDGMETSSGSEGSKYVCHVYTDGAILVKVALVPD